MVRVRPLLAALAALAASLALVAASCGGDDSDAAATVDWANDFCTAVTDWTSALGTIGESLGDPSALNEDALRDAVEDVNAATEELVEDVRALGRPDTESGDEIESTIDSFADAVEAEKEEVEQALEDAEGITGAVSAATSISASVQAMGTEFQTAFERLEDLDPDGELEDAFEQADACEEIAS